MSSNHCVRRWLPSLRLNSKFEGSHPVSKAPTKALLTWHTSKFYIYVKNLLKACNRRLDAISDQDGSGPPVNG
jgi:hypothetical protein